ncbi:MAG: hypothetical protein M1285_02935 [Candidatus Thermoplasmatota archaeon]|nr:hypothetical protein [Candidatus Thermoplasmatota archaeon]
MASGNDPANIAYIIVDNGFYYVAYKEKARVPEVVVSSKGVANGLSEEYNDGWDFGPDSYDPTSTANPPYTQTTGIKEAWNYAFATATTNYPNQNNIKPGAHWMKPIKLLEGIFILNEQVVLDPQVPIANPKMIGSGTMSTYVYWNFNDHAIVINPSNTNITYSNIEIGYIQPQPGGNVTGNVGFFAMTYTSSDSAYQTNTFQSYDMDLAAGNAYVFWLQGPQHVVFYNIQAYNNSGTVNSSGAFHIENCSGSVYAIGCPHISSNYLNGAGELYIIGGNGGNQLTIGNVNYVYINVWALYNTIWLLSDVPYIHIDSLETAYSGPFIVSSGSTSFTVDHIKIGELLYSGNTGQVTAFTGSGTGYSTANVNLLELGRYTFEGTNGGGISGVWTFTPTLSANPPASATVYQNTNPYDIEIDLPVYATTAGTAGYVTIAKGATSTPSAIGNQYVSGDTSDTSEQIIRLRVPANWYYEFTASGVTFGTASVFAD